MQRCINTLHGLNTLSAINPLCSSAYLIGFCAQCFSCSCYTQIWTRPKIVACSFCMLSFKVRRLNFNNFRAVTSFVYFYSLFFRLVFNRYAINLETLLYWCPFRGIWFYSSLPAGSTVYSDLNSYDQAWSIDRWAPTALWHCNHPKCSKNVHNQSTSFHFFNNLKVSSIMRGPSPVMFACLHEAMPAYACKLYFEVLNACGKFPLNIPCTWMITTTKVS